MWLEEVGLRHRGAAIVALAGSAVVLVAAGVALASWWTIAGGFVAAAGAAWISTEPTRGS